MRISPFAEAYCSTHPYFPQAHRSVSLWNTVICPISPAIPWAPASTFPFRMTAPPTPVPSVTITISRYPLPPPCHSSPRAAAFASLQTQTFFCRRIFNCSCTGHASHPRFTAPLTTPSRPAIPGVSMPTPMICSSASPRSLCLCSSEAATCSIICSPCSLVSVGISHFSISFPLSVNRPSLQLVPPTSTPKPYFSMFSPCPQHLIVFSPVRRRLFSLSSL